MASRGRERWKDNVPRILRRVVRGVRRSWLFGAGPLPGDGDRPPVIRGRDAMKSVIKNISLSIVSVLVCLGACELLVRRIAPQQLVLINSREIWRPDPLVG